MRIDARVRAEEHFHACRIGGGEAGALDFRDRFFLLEGFRQYAILLALGQRVLGIVDIHGEIDAALLREFDRLSVQDAGMLDRVDTRQDGVADPDRAVGVACHFQAACMGFLDHRSQLFQRALGRAEAGAFREDAAG